MEEIKKIKQRFGIIGNTDKLNVAIKTAIKVAPTEITVLISGENGSGKESFSKIIHYLSKHKHGKFIAINCGAIPEGTIDSELFGHEKGAFTGAADTRKGYFEEVNGGTIFLDEISEMPFTTQARLLRILEHGEYIRVGSSKIMKTDVRVIAATNKDLQSLIEKNKFRIDLFYRLNSVTIKVPPLRQRNKDIHLLFRKFASDFAEKYNVLPIKLTDDGKEALLKYPFPGNIRELKNITYQISILEKDKLIDSTTLNNYLPKQQDIRLPKLYNKKNIQSNDLMEKEIIYKAIFEIKRDLNNLKHIVFDLINGKKNSNSKELPPHKQNINNIENIQLIETETYQSNNDKVNTTKEEDLSIEKKEKELIKKALKKHNHKRKKAANELGISERTLYRKIKQYKLE